jgi:hypothetical protein
MEKTVSEVSYGIDLSPREKPVHGARDHDLRHQEL